jgi:hypothetical protein
MLSPKNGSCEYDALAVALSILCRSLPYPQAQIGAPFSSDFRGHYSEDDGQYQKENANVVGVGGWRRKRLLGLPVGPRDPPEAQ